MERIRSSTAGDQARFGAAQTAGDSDALGRMKQLKKLREADMISESEYERKRAEILKDL
jgi:putative oligomerization/nucleic acid binding protein